MNVMVVGLLAIVAYFVVVAIWMKRQAGDLPTASDKAGPDETGGTS